MRLTKEQRELMSKLGKRGGAKKGGKKASASRENLAKARQRRWPNKSKTI
jgi:hypothetical protein